jgi:DNA repair protein RadC
LEGILLTLTREPAFSAEDAKRMVEEASPGFVTQTLNAVVKAGILSRHDNGPDARFRWNARDPEPIVRQWIDREIHGDQVKETPEQERPRERLLREGAAKLSDADLLAILIRVGVPKESAVTGGRRIANRFADRLETLRVASLSELRDVSRAATKASYCQIMAGIELGRRVAAAEANRPPELSRITSTSAAVEYCERRFAHLAGDAVQEEFHIVTLDTKHKPIQTHQITVGTLDASLVHPREVFRPAIRDAASAVLLVHNHPSGDPTPSREDHQVTDRLTRAGELLGITVLDHIVVARERTVSLREEG